MGARLPGLLPMQPYLREMVWGGRRLESLFGKQLPPQKPIGEAFELSAYSERESRVAAGPLAGRDLRGLLTQYRQALVGESVWARYGEEFPLLIKLLDPQQDLSIQVHPDDAYAQKNDLGPLGKMEAWFVLHSDGGRIAYGLKPGVERQDLAQAAADGRVEEVVEFYTARRGDVVFSPPGTVHALCSGVIIYEVQQSSDLTFRLFDYNRLGLDGKRRDLHIEQSLEVIDFKAELPGVVPWRQLPGVSEEGGLLVNADYFQLELHRPAAAKTHRPAEVFRALTLISGRATVRSGEEHYPVSTGSTVLVPAGGGFAVEPLDDAQCEYLLAVPVV
jgi:mannose-6-phosphate isomerase